jgi:DNA repair exonuclease SbcCD nuclease subunit
VNGFIITGDVHAHAYPGATFEDGANRRLADIVACLDSAIELAGKHSAEDIIVAGDLFHDRKGVRPEVLHRIGEWLERCHDHQIKVTILTGNHDLSIGGDGCASVMALTRAAHIVTTACVLELGGRRFGFLPYTDDRELVAKTVKRLAKEKAEVLIGHVGIGDPKYSACVPVDYEVPGRISVDDLRPDDFAQVFLAHYHNAQTLAANVHYVGSPLQLSFKEVGQEKSLVVWNGKRMTRVVNDVSPRYHKAPAAEILKTKISERDFVHATSATRDEEEQLRHVLGDEMVLRIERRVAADVTQRLAISGSETENMTAFARLRRPDLDPAQLADLVSAGAKYLQHGATNA